MSDLKTKIMLSGCVGLIAFGVASAQVTITAEDVMGWQGGRYNDYGFWDTIAGNQTEITSKSNATWDFSVFQIQNEEIAIAFDTLTPSEKIQNPNANRKKLLLNYGAYGDCILPGCTLDVTMEKVTSFRYVSLSQLKNGTTQGITDTIMNFPVNFNDSIFNSGIEYFYENGVPNEYTKKIIRRIKGFGSVKLPGGTIFNDVLCMSALTNIITPTYTVGTYYITWYSKNIGCIAEIYLELGAPVNFTAIDTIKTINGLINFQKGWTTSLILLKETTSPVSPQNILKKQSYNSQRNTPEVVYSLSGKKLGSMAQVRSAGVVLVRSGNLPVQPRVYLR